MLRSVPVRFKGRPYNIHIGSGALSELGKLLVRHKLTGTAFVVSQEAVWKVWGGPLRSQLSSAGIGVETFVAPAKLESEKLKSLPFFLKILDALVAADRKSRGVFVIALGGGVAGDVSGFAASVYKRGVAFVQVPTTLTAQVDSAIGGKTAIDLPRGKNLLGAFHQPKFVLSDTRILSSLPEPVYRDGLAEVVKYGVISDAKFLDWIEKNTAAILRRDPGAVEKIVTVSARIKAKVVAEDEFDTKGVRMILNYGHTIGHALEAASGYMSLTHGRAVAIGMCGAADLSAGAGILKDPAFPARLRGILRGLGLPTAIPAKLDRKKILEAIFYDKKRKDGKHRFVLVEKPGKTRIDPDVTENAIDAVVRGLYEKPQPLQRRSSEGLLGKWFKPGAKKPQARGTVENYLDRIGVAIIRWEKGALEKGDALRIEGASTRLALEAGSLQIDRVEVARVKRGDVFGMKVPAPVRAGDKVF
jgi:3-dehydroquinate synthase